MNGPRPSMLRAALIGGAVGGALSGLPVIKLLNCFCCSLVIGAGFLAAYLYSGECRRAGVDFDPSSGALVGLLAALFYAMADALVQALFLVVGQAWMGSIFEMIQRSGQQIPPQVSALLDFVKRGGLLVLLPFQFGLALLIGGVFSTIGGLIGGAVFRTEPAPSAPPV
ncbi:MAG TPA: hypothetical protein VJS92_06595 [Candidatus Polarisedimenticolaceae bacterium]|nr:hypothetical protein [Candidatus Polarisedimenticolaceae bacterium]